jgi:hypothetical protein
LECPGIKEESLFQKIFDEDTRIDQRDFEEKDSLNTKGEEKKQKPFKKLKKLFKKGAD